MVEILKKGNAHIVQASGRVTCPKCNSELRVNKSDLKNSYDLKTSYDPRDQGGSALWFTCPVCDRMIYSNAVAWGT